MSNSEVFPIEWGPSENRRPMKSIFMDHREQSVSWYAYSLSILDYRTVSFTVYDMFDMVYGGVGQKQYEFTVVLTSEEQEHPDLREFIAKKVRQAAVAQRAHELDIAEEEIIQSYIRNIRATTPGLQDS